MEVIKTIINPVPLLFRSWCHYIKAYPLSSKSSTSFQIFQKLPPGFSALRLQRLGYMETLCFSDVWGYSSYFQNKE